MRLGKPMFALFPLAVILTGCATMMPSKITTITSLCKDYAEAKAVYDSLEPHKTTLADLAKTCLSPSQSNTNLLSGRIIQQMFLPSPAVKLENLPKGIQQCLQNLESCGGFESFLKDTKDKGVGNFALRAFRCKRDNLVKGPDAVFQFFLMGELMVFKDHVGKADVNIVFQERNPLCLLQEPGDIIMKYTPTP